LDQIVSVLRSQPVIEGATWAERRAGMEAMQAALPLPDDVAREPADAAGVPVEWISTPGAAADRAVLYLHGGGYAIGSIATHRFLMQGISRAAGCRVLGVDYRLAPENPYPAAVDDAVASWGWLLEQGLEPGRCAIAGDSAGGGLTLATLVRSRDEGRPLPAAAACLSPWSDLSGSGASVTSKADEDPMVTGQGLAEFALAYHGPIDATHELVSPLFADLAGLPPLLVQVGSAEILLDDATRLAERARGAGVDVELEVWDDMIHVFQAFPTLAESGRAIEGIGRFVRAHTG
jgi:acetyl esterase/lipase